MAIHRLLVLVLIGPSLRRLRTSLVWNEKAKQFNMSVIYATSECSQVMENLVRAHGQLIQCLRCCPGGSTSPSREWRDKTGMVRRLHNALHATLQFPYTHVLKVDDDTRVQYGALHIFCTQRSHGRWILYGQCEYAPWEQRVFCGGGAGVVLSRPLVRRVLNLHSTPKGAEDVVLSSEVRACGGTLSNVNGFHPHCDEPITSHTITQHHCVR
jgi:hypothetical protein